MTSEGSASSASSRNTFALDAIVSYSGCSDDAISSTRQEVMEECPICCELFNISKNVPCVLLCGHTMCQHCILGLQCAVVKVSTVPILLQFLVSCPWCNLLSFRVSYQGNLVLPRINHTLLWMVKGNNTRLVESSKISAWNHSPRASALSSGQSDSQSDSSHFNLLCSDEASTSTKQVCIECPICLESFDTIKNVPCVLLCGHTICQNCILGLHRAVVKAPIIAIQLPLSIPCMWCNIPSLRVFYRRNLIFPRKNYFLLSMVESRNTEIDRTYSSVQEFHSRMPLNNASVQGHADDHTSSMDQCLLSSPSNGHASASRNLARWQLVVIFLRKLLAFLVHLIAESPILVILLLAGLCAYSVNAAVLAMYILVVFLLCAGLVC